MRRVYIYQGTLEQALPGRNVETPEGKPVLLRGHGLTTAGRSVEECTQRSLTVYELARMNWLAYAIGGPNQIPQQDIDEYRRRGTSGEERTRRPDRAGVAGEMSSGWRYQKKLLERQGL